MSRGMSRDMWSGSGQCITTASSTAASAASTTSRRVSGGLGAKALRAGRNTFHLIEGVKRKRAAWIGELMATDLRRIFQGEAPAKRTHRVRCGGEAAQLFANKRP